MHRVPPSRLSLLSATVILSIPLIGAIARPAAPAGAPTGPVTRPESAAVTAAEPVTTAVTGALPDGAAVAEAAGLPVTVDAADRSTEEALRALAPRVRNASHPDALRTAFQAYFNYRTAHPDNVAKPYLYFVDMGLNNRTARGYVFDMDRLLVVEGPFTVAHGRGSAASRDAVPSRFSNRPGSKATSLGLYLAQETYSFSGKLSGRRYSSVGLRMRGESGEFNGKARARGIVAHGAPYVSAGQAGRSEGCPAMEMDRARRLLPLIAHGGVVFIYSPNDARWLRADPWINAD